jgi:hypothetical protein
MSDTPKEDGRKPPHERDEDEPIIDLVDEVGRKPQEPLSRLEGRLLGLEEENEPDDLKLPELPDLSELGNLDFDEEDEPAPQDSPSSEAPAAADEASQAEGELDWLFEPEADTSSAGEEQTPGSADSENIDSAEQFLDAEEILDDLPDLGEKTDSTPEDDTLELLDIEEEEIDDEIIWFDDVEKASAALESDTPAGEAAAPTAEPEEPVFPETSAADLFEAHLASETGRPEKESGPDVADILTPPAAALGEMAAAPEPLPTEAPAPADKTPPAIEPAAPSAEDIEAAVERVIARKLGGSIETIILQAIEKAVSKEIERIRHLILEDDPRDRA